MQDEGHPNRTSKVLLGIQDLSLKGVAMLDVDLDGASFGDQSCVVIADCGKWLLAKALIQPLPLVLLAVISDDPDSWDEMNHLWPRHRTTGLPKFLSSIVFDSVSREQAYQTITQDPRFVWIDLRSKRVATGSHFAKTGGDTQFATRASGVGAKSQPIGIHLPPWWQLLENVEAHESLAESTKPIKRPLTDRSVLYGGLMFRFIAESLWIAFTEHDRTPINVTRHQALKAVNTSEPFQIPYEIQLRIHREWLMTPRAEMCGKRPREILHGCHAWIESLIKTQRARYLSGLPNVAAPADLGSVVHGPIGFSEMVMYFEYCRHLLSAGWDFLGMHSGQQGRFVAIADDAKRRNFFVDRLVEFMCRAADLWMESAYEGGATPRTIIECDRRRVARGIGVPIEGMFPFDAPIGSHEEDLPEADAMDESVVGPAFEFLCGHQLELDGEFAFSGYATREEWERYQADAGCCEGSREFHSSPRLHSDRESHSTRFDDPASDETSPDSQGQCVPSR